MSLLTSSLYVSLIINSIELAILYCRISWKHGSFSYGILEPTIFCYIILN